MNLSIAVSQKCAKPANRDSETEKKQKKEERRNNNIGYEQAISRGKHEEEKPKSVSVCLSRTISYPNIWRTGGYHPGKTAGRWMG